MLRELAFGLVENSVQHIVFERPGSHTSLLIYALNYVVSNDWGIHVAS